MAFLLSNLPSSLTLQPRSSQEKPIPNSQSPLLLQLAAKQSSTFPCSSFSPSLYPQTKLESPPLRVAQVKEPPLTSSSSQVHDDDGEKNNFYVNLGLAVRTLREDYPQLFTKDLNYDIYRDDITLVDPLNTFNGIDNYKLIFWALRFHGKILFREIGLDVLRIWQPSENTILIRWNLRGVPRVPWEAKGEFQGTSWYKLDRTGKIYEHKVDNLAFNFPRPMKPAATVLDMVAACPASPSPTMCLWDQPEPEDYYSSSWVKFYRAVKQTLDCGGNLPQQDGMVVACF